MSLRQIFPTLGHLFPRKQQREHFFESTESKRPRFYVDKKFVKSTKEKRRRKHFSVSFLLDKMSIYTPYNRNRHRTINFVLKKRKTEMDLCPGKNWKVVLTIVINSSVTNEKKIFFLVDSWCICVRRMCANTQTKTIFGSHLHPCAQVSALVP